MAGVVALAAAAGRAEVPSFGATHTKFEYRIPMRDGARLYTTVYRPKDAATNAPISFNSPVRPRIGGVTSRWPLTFNRPVEGPTGCPVYRLLHPSAVILGIRPSTRNTGRRRSTFTQPS